MYDTCAAIVVGMRSLLSLSYARSLDFFALLFRRLRVFLFLLHSSALVKSYAARKSSKLKEKWWDIITMCLVVVHSMHVASALHVQFVLFTIIYFFQCKKERVQVAKKAKQFFSRISWMYSLNGTKSRFHFQLLQFQLFSVKKIY